MHEHLLWGPYGWEYDPDWFYSYPKVLEKCFNDLGDFREEGGLTFVDLSGVGLGRDIELYRLLEKSTGVNVVACTGFWAQLGVPPYFQVRDIDYHTEMYVREITEGIGTSGGKAGIIKLGHWRTGLNTWEEMHFRAGARAAKKTGCAVTTHGVEAAEAHLEVLLSEGLEPERIIIGHLDSFHAEDFERDKRLGKKGAWLGYDHATTYPTWSPMHYAASDEWRADRVKAMIDAGFLNQLIISADVNSISLGWQRSAPFTGKTVVADLLRLFLPKLRRSLVTEDQIRTMLVDNPRKALPIYA
jgi:phosphotriesterase-related protein